MVYVSFRWFDSMAVIAKSTNIETISRVLNMVHVLFRLVPGGKCYKYLC